MPTAYGGRVAASPSVRDAKFCVSTTSVNTPPLGYFARISTSINTIYYHIL